MMDPRPFDEVATDLIDDATDKVKFNRKQANKLLDKANEIVEMAEQTAEKLREAAAALIIEASGYADSIADYLEAEYPMSGGEVEEDE
jgi:F0F1-type ATP synthase membrane subunit b/b'